MEPLHSRVLPSTLHTLDDLVFASFQGPVLGLSSRVLHRYRAFTALLLLRTRWRTDRRLSQDEVATTLLRARCYRPGSFAPVQCRICGGVLGVSENVVEQERLRREVPDGIELYAVTLRTLCTSSRKHVGSTMLVLAADIAPGVVVVSDRFAIYARHAARHIAGGGHSPTEPSSPQGSSSSSEDLWSLAATSPAGPDLRLLGPRGAMAVCVCVLGVSGLTPEDHQTISSGLVPVLRANVPGYLVHKTSINPTVVIMVVGALSPADLALVDRFSARFTKNEIRNPFKKDLVAAGLVQQLLITNNVE
eukprot:m51a1_g1387 hypothetical protein (305) ;mRNA; f:463498-464521